MIINLDDLKYVVLCAPNLLSNDKMIKIVRSLLTIPDLGWVLYLFSVYHLDSRLIDVDDAPFDPMEFYHLSYHFYLESGWPEMEEKIRRDPVYKNMYEKRVGITI